MIERAGWGWNAEAGGSRYGTGVVAAMCGGLGLRTRMRLFSCGRAASSSSSSSSSVCDEGMGRLRLPLDESRSSVLANQDKGAVTMFFMVPSKDSERARGFGLRRRWLSGELDDGGIGKPTVSHAVTS